MRKHANELLYELCVESEGSTSVESAGFLNILELMKHVVNTLEQDEGITEGMKFETLIILEHNLDGANILTLDKEAETLTVDAVRTDINISPISKIIDMFTESTGSRREFVDRFRSFYSDNAAEFSKAQWGTKMFMDKIITVTSGVGIVNKDTFYFQVSTKDSLERIGLLVGAIDLAESDDECENITAGILSGNPPRFFSFESGDLRSGRIPTKDLEEELREMIKSHEVVETSEDPRISDVIATIPSFVISGIKSSFEKPSGMVN